MTKKEINNLAKGYKEAEIYFHIDLDGVLSAMVMIEYLKTINVKTAAVHPIQYGPREYSIPKPDLNKLQILVDFNSGKPYMNIHTDHHDKQTGFIDTALTSFEINRSNATTLNKILFDDKLLSKLDSFVVDTIDSADYAR
jgi:single-stranded DNA-specific DHH superfamily exonuclease